MAAAARMPHWALWAWQLLSPLCLCPWAPWGLASVCPWGLWHLCPLAALHGARVGVELVVMPPASLATPATPSRGHHAHACPMVPLLLPRYSWPWPHHTAGRTAPYSWPSGGTVHTATTSPPHGARPLAWAAPIACGASSAPAPPAALGDGRATPGPPPHFSVGSWRWSGHGAASCGQLLPLPCDESQPFRIQPRINKIRITPRHIHPSRSVQGGAPASDVVGREVTERQLLQEKARAGMPRQAYSNPENNTTALAFRHTRSARSAQSRVPPGTAQGQGPKRGSPKRKLPARAETPVRGRLGFGLAVLGLRVTFHQQHRVHFRFSLVCLCCIAHYRY